MLPLPKSSIKKIVIGCIIAVILIIVGIFAYFYFTTDFLKSNEALFAKYIRKAAVNVEEILVDNKGVEYDNLLQNNKYLTNIEVTGNYTSGIGTTTEGSQENVLNNLKLIINGKTDAMNNVDYKDIVLEKNEEQALQLQYLKSNDKYGVRVSGLFDKYLAVDNKNLKEVAQKMEVKGNVPNKIGDYKNIKNTLTFTVNEINQVNDTYAPLISEKFNKAKFTKSAKEQIELNNGTQVLANAYTLNLTKEELNNVYISLLEKMKQDELLLTKVRGLEEILNPKEVSEEDVNQIMEQGQEEQNQNEQEQNQEGEEPQENQENQENQEEEKSAEEIYIDRIDKIITDVKNKNIGNDNCQITVYETEGESVRTEITTQEYKIIIESSFAEDGTIYLDVNKEVYGSIEDNIENFEVEKKADSISINWLKKNEGTTKKASFVQDRVIANGKQEKNTKITYDIGSNKIELNIKDNKEVLNDFDSIEEFTDNNNVTLNDLTDDEYTEIKEILNDRGIEKLNEVTQKVDFNELFNILYELKLLSKQIDINSLVTLTKSEVSRFNAEFELYQGEGLTVNALEGLIKTVQNNLDTVEVLPNNSIKLNISKGKVNEQLATKVRELVNSDENKGKKYTVSFEYNEETQMVSAVIITREEN